MKDKYDRAINLIYNITKEHSQKEPIGGMEILEVLDCVLEYIKEKTLKQIYSNSDDIAITERISDYSTGDYAMEAYYAYADDWYKKLDAEVNS